MPAKACGSNGFAPRSRASSRMVLWERGLVILRAAAAVRLRFRPCEECGFVFKLHLPLRVYSNPIGPDCDDAPKQIVFRDHEQHLL
jgi:hypothetical protein